MELSKPEVGAVAKLEEDIQELDQLQLAMIGGGIGDVVLG